MSATSRLFLAAAIAATTAPAQTIDDVRDTLRASAGVGRQTAFVAAFVDLSESAELAAGTLRVRTDPPLDATTLKLPWYRDVVGGLGWADLRLEAGVGWFHADATFADLWSGALPGLETEVHATWAGLSAFAGAGPRFPLGRGVHATPLVDLSAGYLWSDADYAGPGAPVTAAVADGILFNWRLFDFTYGAAALLEHELALSEKSHLRSVVRYDLRRTAVVHSTDAAQDADAVVQRIVAREGLQGPTGLHAWGTPLDWSAHVAWTRFLGSNRDLLGFDGYFEVGGGLATAGATALPVAGLNFAFAVIFGEDVRGWSIGFGINF